MRAACSTSARRRIGGFPAFSRPPLEDALHVAPVAPIVGDRLVEGVLDPGGWVELGRGPELVRDQGLDQADVLLVQLEDRRAAARPGDWAGPARGRRGPRGGG